MRMQPLGESNRKYEQQIPSDTRGDPKAKPTAMQDSVHGGKKTRSMRSAYWIRDTKGGMHAMNLSSYGLFPG